MPFDFIHVKNVLCLKKKIKPLKKNHSSRVQLRYFQGQSYEALLGMKNKYFIAGSLNGGGGL